MPYYTTHQEIPNVPSEFLQLILTKKVIFTIV